MMIKQLFRPSKIAVALTALGSLVLAAVSIYQRGVEHGIATRPCSPLPRTQPDTLQTLKWVMEAGNGDTTWSRQMVTIVYTKDPCGRTIIYPQDTFEVE